METPLLTFEGLKQKYTAKEEYTVNAKISDISGKYIAFVYHKVPVNRFKKEYADTAVASIITANINEFYKFLQPYLRQR